MNDWYIDRSKSFVETDLKATMQIIRQIQVEGKNSDASLITARLKNAGVRGVSPSNAYAALTRFRDHGLITRLVILLICISMVAWNLGSLS